MDFAYDFVFNDPSYFVIFLKGGFLIISSGLEVILGYIFSSISVCLNYLESISPSLVCLNFSGIFIILFSCELARLEFAVLFF